MKTKEQIDRILNTHVPSIAEVNEYVDKWQRLDDYRDQENALDKLFVELCPKNDNLDDIMIKCSALNDFYSTNIFKIRNVATHILELNIDERLSRGNFSLVEDIAHVNITDKKGVTKIHNFYSFATKYCSHHQPLKYSIYDNYVHRLLVWYRNKDQFSHFTNEDMKCYPSYRDIINDFVKYYHLDGVDLKSLDKYLWQLGKEAFNPYVE